MITAQFIRSFASNWKDVYFCESPRLFLEHFKQGPEFSIYKFENFRRYHLATFYTINGVKDFMQKIEQIDIILP